MMNANEKLKKEQDKLSVYKEKREEINKKIKECEEEISKLNEILNQQKFDEATSVLKASGITLEEVLNAVKTGNLNELQGKISK